VLTRTPEKKEERGVELLHKMIREKAIRGREGHISAYLGRDIRSLEERITNGNGESRERTVKRGIREYVATSTSGGAVERRGVAQSNRTELRNNAHIKLIFSRKGEKRKR